MPTEEEVVDKAYVKKHKLNHTLNELFLALTQNKPDNPIEFAKEFFQAKLPPPPETPKKEASLLNISNPNSAVTAALSGLSALNRVNRIAVKTSKTISEDDLIENEKIVFIRHGNLNEIEENLEKLEIVSYKSDLKKREMINRHKLNLKNLIQENLNNKENNKIESKLLTRSGADSNQNDIGEDAFAHDSSEDEILLDEIGMANNPNYVAKKKKKINKKKLDEDKRISYRASIRNQSVDNTMLSDRNVESSRRNETQEYVCSKCGKSKSKENILELNASIQTLKDEPVKEESTKEEENNKSNVTNKTGKNFFELLTQNLEPKKTNESFDDENIESASQVSGPRPITPFDPGTSRSVNQNKLDETNTSGMSSGVLGWLMSTNQYMNQIDQKLANVNEETNTNNKPKKTESVVSKASTLKNAKQNVSSNSEVQHWRMHSPSGSELSARSKTNSKTSIKK